MPQSLIQTQKNSAAQLVFYRGFTSKHHVKGACCSSDIVSFFPVVNYVILHGIVRPSSDLIMQLVNVSFCRCISVSFSTTKEMLADAFSQFGQLNEATIIMDKGKNRSKGYGYVTFSREEEA
ncbi:hypothetical protein CUMW_239860 [Citrus unshiu]|uniref:RRM domain-containing protein n=1 Tax=Citrus unshiu TaxID=55188 RepID=A0A2H5QKX4_CITUN|nr:hypothetical protein CUMW_239860 [Citrus unshiu]